MTYLSHPNIYKINIVSEFYKYHHPDLLSFRVYSSDYIWLRELYLENTVLNDYSIRTSEIDNVYYRIFQTGDEDLISIIKLMNSDRY